MVHTENIVDTDNFMIDNEPLDVYSRKDMYDDEVMDTIYVNNREFETLY